jgi:hypothetical protein
MDLLILSVGLLVGIYLIYFILEKTTIGPPLRRVLLRTLLWFWRGIKKTDVGLPEEFTEKLNAIEISYAKNEKQRQRRLYQEARKK